MQHGWHESCRGCSSAQKSGLDPQLQNNLEHVQIHCSIFEFYFIFWCISSFHQILNMAYKLPMKSSTDLAKLKYPFHLFHPQPHVRTQSDQNPGRPINNQHRSLAFPTEWQIKLFPCLSDKKGLFAAWRVWLLRQIRGAWHGHNKAWVDQQRADKLSATPSQNVLIEQEDFVYLEIGFCLDCTEVMKNAGHSAVEFGVDMRDGLLARMHASSAVHSTEKKCSLIMHSNS